jgi:hypothetical protein
MQVRAGGAGSVGSGTPWRERAESAKSRPLPDADIGNVSTYSDPLGC